MAKIPSEFVPLDVNMAHDGAIRAAGPMAELLFVRGLMYARRTKSLGRLPRYDLPVYGVGIPAVAKHAAALVREGLWVAEDDGWRIRSWDRWNPASSRKAQAKQSRGGSLGNHNRWHVNGTPRAGCEFCDADRSDIGLGSVPTSVSDRSRAGSDSAVRAKTAAEDPGEIGLTSGNIGHPIGKRSGSDRSSESVSDRKSREEESREEEEGSVGTYRGDPATSGRELETVSPDTVFPRSWTPATRHRAYAMENRLDLQHEARMFAEHARANGRTAVDWDAAFMTWLGKAKPRPLNGSTTDQRVNDGMALAHRLAADEPTKPPQIGARP